MSKVIRLETGEERSSSTESVRLFDRDEVPPEYYSQAVPRLAISCRGVSRKFRLDAVFATPGLMYILARLIKAHSDVRIKYPIREGVSP